MKDHPSFEFYKTRKLNIKDDADRKLVTEFWTQFDTDVSTWGGKTMRYSKVYKWFKFDINQN